MKHLVKTLSLLTLFTLCGCKQISSSSISNSSSNSISFATTNETSSSLQTTSNKTNSSSKGTSSATPSTESSTKNDNILSENDALNYLKESQNFDNLISSCYTLKYIIKATSYQTQNANIKSYKNNINISEGTTRNYTSNGSNYDVLSAKFKEEKIYQNNYFYDIKKFENTYLNSASKESLSEDKAKDKINIALGLEAYTTYLTFQAKLNLTYEGYYKDNGNIYMNFLNYIETDYQGVNFVTALEIEINKAGYICDLFYSEGYYDTYYCESITKIRNHGPTTPDGIAEAGYTYSVSRIKINEKEDFDLSELPFKIEDNFITSLSFNITKLSFNLADETKYIDLTTYLISSPEGSLVGFDKCPYNNLSFTSSNSKVASIGDQFYLDFISKGETEITAFDRTNSVISNNKLIVEIL